MGSGKSGHHHEHNLLVHLAADDSLDLEGTDPMAYIQEAAFIKAPWEAEDLSDEALHLLCVGFYQAGVGLGETGER